MITRHGSARGVVLALIASLVVGPGLADAQGKRSTMTRVKGTRVTMLKPDLFVHAPYGTAFQFASGGAEIQVSELPQSFERLRDHYVSQANKAPDMKLAAREDVEVGGLPGVLLVLHPKEGVAFSRWVLVFGTDKESVLAVAIAPSDQRKAYNKVYRRILLSSEWNAESQVKPYEGLPFFLTGKSLFEFASRYKTSLTFSRGGEVERRSADDPVLVVTLVQRRVPEESYEQVCKQSLEQTAILTEVRIIASGPFDADGMKGCEILAEGRSAQDSRPMMVYDANLFEKSRFYNFKGIAGVRFRAQYVSEFARMARQIRRK